jgi:hypothetical protein
MSWLACGLATAVAGGSFDLVRDGRPACAIVVAEHPSLAAQLAALERMGKKSADNLLAIRLDNPAQSSRWYPGGGIYRNVWLVKTTPIHVAQWGTFVTTPDVSSAAARSLKACASGASAVRGAAGHTGRGSASWSRSATVTSCRKHSCRAGGRSPGTWGGPAPASTTWT